MRDVRIMQTSSHDRYRTLAILAIICFSGVVSCISNAPAFPEKDGTRYLTKHGYDEDVIKKVLAMQDIGDKLFAKLAAEKSTDVRFLVAKNPHLPKRLHEELIQDRDDFVRGGAALSPHLTEEQIAVEISKHREPSSSNHTVLIYIARNPSVSKPILLDLHEQHGIELVWFAFNPNCPEEFIQKMNATNDRDALYELKASQQREKYKKQHEQ